MARQRPTEYTEVALEQVVQAVLELLGYGIRANGIEVDCRIEPALPTLWCDQDQLSQLLLNLVINAQQALLDVQGVRWLRIEAKRAQYADLIELEVTDNGPGVPQELRQRIFEPFFTTKPVGVGTGIGLSLCHSIVKNHGGSIEINDASGGGALFRVTLPLGEPGAESGYETESIASEGAAEPILIVDDEPEIAELLSDILISSGYQTVLAHSGEHALEQLEKQSFALILSDIRMPELDGPGLYQALVERFPDMAKRLVFVTGDILQSIDSNLRVSRVPIIEKPFNPADIVRIVSEQLAITGTVSLDT